MLRLNCISAFMQIKEEVLETQVLLKYLTLRRNNSYV